MALGSPSTHGLYKVKGNLTLAGRLNINDMGGFGPGLYRLFNYDGTLIDKGLKLGTVPGGSSSASGISIQTAVNKQVNLINNIGIKAGFWDGGDLAHADNHAINGGNGVWNLVNDNWTDGNGAKCAMAQWHIRDLRRPGRRGHDAGCRRSHCHRRNAILDRWLSGSGDAIALATADGTTPIIRVDRGPRRPRHGIARHAGPGQDRLRRAGLHGREQLQRVTTVRDGTLQLGDGGTSGSIRGDVVVGSHAYGPGTLAIDRSDELVLRGAISGGGRVVQLGDGGTRQHQGRCGCWQPCLWPRHAGH